MEPTVTIPVEDYNKLIDIALGNVLNVEKIVTRLREIYKSERNPSLEHYNTRFKIDFESASQSLIEHIKERKGDIPQAIKEWTKNISSEKSES